MATPKCGPSVIKRENILVYARVRPMNEKERLERKNMNVVELKSNREVVVRDRANHTLTRTFAFDRAFGPTSKQVDVYKAVAQPMIAEVLEGYNCTIFAYGQTGTGKTFTMEGERADNDATWEKDPLCGLVPRVLSHMFDELRLKNIEFTMAVSYLELYNEELIDLLSPEEDNSKLKLFEDASSKGSVIVQGLTDVRVLDKKQVYEILSRGSKKRQTAATFMNASSSRSHTIFTVTIHIREPTEAGEDLIRTGKINLVDLAGSENISRSGATNQRAKEAGNINQSLLTLGRVITSLVEKTPHVPYRESKLTRLLQDSLGGKTKTAIVATVSPVLANLEETLSTLDYAHRAKSITNRPQINQRLSKQAFIKEYDQEIERLRKDLMAQRLGSGIYVDPENYREMEEKIVRLDVEVLEKIQNIRALEEEREKREAHMTQLTEQLHRTETTLMITEKTLVEKEVLLENHINTEENLKVETNQLIEVTDATTSDLAKTHDALLRRQRLEMENQTVTGAFSAQLNRQVQEGKLSLEESCSAHEHHLANIANGISQSGQLQSEMSALFSSRVAAIREQFMFKQMNQLFHMHHERMVDLERQAVQLADSNCENILRMLMNLVAQQQEQLAQASLEKLRENLTLHYKMADATVADIYTGCIDQMTAREKDLQGELLSVKSKAENLELELAAAKKKIEQLQANIVSSRTSSNTNYQDISAFLQEVLEKTKQKLSTACQQNEENHDQLGDQLQFVSNDMELHIQEAYVMKHEAEACAKRSSAWTTSTIDFLSKSKEESHLNMLREASMADEEVQAANAVLTEVSESVVAQGQELETAINEGGAALVASSKKRADTRQEQLVAQETLLRQTETGMAAAAADAIAAAEEKKAQMEQQLAESVLEVEATRKATCEAKAAVSRNLDAVQSSVDKFLASDLQKYAPTGATPAKQDRDYPRELKFSSPAPRVLARFYANQQNRPRERQDSGVTSPDGSPISSKTSNHENEAQDVLDAVDMPKKTEQIRDSRRILGSRN
ncbi:kinesin-like protein Klp61F isoform X2 [Cloeon dipterum]|uniref:kinesin-like protein Klp61F isoform X2 n=1 Tax=Cloeon dipterum TaxID=197152 RepID=UPI00321FF8FE